MRIVFTTVFRLAIIVSLALILELSQHESRADQSPLIISEQVNQDENDYREKYNIKTIKLFLESFEKTPSCDEDTFWYNMLDYSYAVGYGSAYEASDAWISYTRRVQDNVNPIDYKKWWDAKNEGNSDRKKGMKYKKSIYSRGDFKIPDDQ